MSDENVSAEANTSMVAALGAALGASVCCIVPLALVGLGVGGAWVGTLTALAPFRWIFVGLSIGALGYAGYSEWQLSRPECECETTLSPTVRRSLLGLAALTSVLLIVSPWLIASSPTAATQQVRAGVTNGEQAAPSQGSAVSASAEKVVLDVEGMTCKACPTTVRKALEQVTGVEAVDATYEPPRAVVHFDPNQASVEDLTQATENAGFPSHQNPPS